MSDSRLREKYPEYKAHQERREDPVNYGIERATGVRPDLDMTRPASYGAANSILYFTTQVKDRRTGDVFEGVVYRYEFEAKKYRNIGEASEAAWDAFFKAKPSLKAAMEEGRVVVMLQHEAQRGAPYLYEYDGEAWRNSKQVFDAVTETRKPQSRAALR